MRICVFGCKSTTMILANNIIGDHNVEEIVTIAPEMGRRAEVADYTDMETWGRENGVRVYTAARYDLKSPCDEVHFRSERYDVGLVMGWQRLIPKEVLRQFKVGVFGMHGSACDLPVGRGRSPMNWALIEGRKLFYTNIFLYDAGVDSGDILDTRAFSITDEDTAETLHYKNVISMIDLFLKNADSIESGEFVLRAQPQSTPTYYPKRSAKDSIIDWHAPIDVLHRFIRAVAPPFNGAFTYLQGEKVVIHRAAIFELDTVPFHHINKEPGEILDVFPSGKFLVKTRGGTLLIHEYDLGNTRRPETGDVFRSPEYLIPEFPVNRHGGYDWPEDTDS